MPAFDLIAFDADDTLWHTERLYVDAQQRFARLLAAYHSPEWINDRLYQTESRNIDHFGYGIKAFALSLIETAVELTEGRVTGAEIQELVGLAKHMLNAPIELLPQVSTVVPALAGQYPMMIITKGDLMDQESKIARSGLSEHFRHVEIVSQKTPERYSALLKKYALEPHRFLMVGNSLRSDILPVLACGANAVYVPYELTWQHEAAHPPEAGQTGYYKIDHLGMLLPLLEQIEQDEGSTGGRHTPP